MVTNCQAQVALDIVLQQKQTQRRALELGEKAVLAVLSLEPGSNTSVPSS